MAFTTIIKDVDGFFTKLFSKTTAAQKILAAAGALAPLIEAGLVVNGEPQVAQAIQEAFTVAQTDLGTFQAIVKQSGTTPTALSVLNAINSNFKAILTESQVKNSTNFTKIQTTVNIAVQEIDAIAAYFPAQDQVSPSCRKPKSSRARRETIPGEIACLLSCSAGRGLTFRFRVDFRGSYRGRRFCKKKPGKCVFPT